MDILSLATPIVLAVLKVAAVALVGFMLARRGVLHETALADLSNLVIKVTVPCLIFANAAGGFTGTSLVSAALAVVGAPLILGLGWLGGTVLGRVLRVQAGHWRAVICASTFENSAYLPIAVATAVLPPLAALFPLGAASAVGAIAANGVVFISLFGVLYSPLFWGLGLWWLSEGAAHDGAAPWTRLLPPPVIGVLLGYGVGLTPLHLALTPRHAPLHFVFSAVSDIGSLTIPLANLILGGMLAGAIAGRRWQWRDAATAALAKLIWVPSATFGLLWLCRGWWEHSAALSLAAFTVFLQALTPPATNLAVMTRGRPMGVSNLAPEVVPGLLLVTYPLSVLTMPLWLTLFFGMMGR